MLALGGAKQRAVLAVLLLHPNEVVHVEQLVDEVWGDDPPPSARHSLEGYVSRLRGVLAPHGVMIARRGPGYSLQLGEASLDAAAFERLAAAGDDADDRGDHARAAELRGRALELWRGSALADVLLRGTASAAVARLEELRLSTLERTVASQLALGRHADVIAELRRLVEEHPYRERFAALLMVALYRCERSAEALEIYERTRRRLDEELGLRPSESLRQLSGAIVRHEPDVAVPAAAPAAPDPARPSPPGPPGRRHLALAAAAATVAVATGIGLLVGGGDDEVTATAGVGPVALVVPRPPEAGHEDTFVAPLVDGLHEAARRWDLDVEVVVADELDPESETRAQAARRLRAGGFGLVLIAGFPLSEALVPLVRELPDTRFVFIEAAVEPLGLQGTSNATGIVFAAEEATYLAGYLAGMVERGPGPRLNADRRISVIGGVRDFPIVESMIDGFVRGAETALPRVRVLRDYSDDFAAQEPCETIANRQIDAGSDIVFPLAGTCSLGALSAAGLRGVWAVGVDADRSYLGPHILASVVKRFDRAVVLAARWMLHDTLPRGRDVTLGLDDGAVALVGISPEVPASVRQAVALEAALLRRRD